MLTDLYALTNSLLKNGVKIKEEANSIKKAAKTNGFLFAFDKESVISDVEHINGADMSKLWRVVESNHKRFPITNLKSPLCVIDSLEIIDFAKELFTVLKEKTLPDFLGYCFNKYSINFNVSNKNVKAISTLAYKYPTAIIKQLKSEISGTAFFDLISDMTMWFSDNEHNVTIQDKTNFIIMRMSAMLCQNALIGKIDNQVDIAAALFGRWNKKKTQFEEPKVQIGFYPTDRKNELFIDSYDTVNKAFLAVSSSKKIGICALSGKIEQPLITDTFPDINLPIIGATKMFAMFKGIPSQYRYNQTGASLFPVSEIEANKVANTLKMVCAPEQRSRTWCAIPRPNTIKGEQDLLIAWIDGILDDTVSVVLKEALPQLCTIHSLKKCSVDGALTKYETTTKNIIDAFTKVNRKVFLNAKQRIVILTETDPGNREVIGNFTYDLKEMLHNIKSWSYACTNDINFRLPINDAESGKVSMVSPYVPSPIGIAILSKNKYTKELKAYAVIGIPINEIFNIFLKSPKKGMVLERKLLIHFYKNVVDLLISFRTDQLISMNYYFNNDKRGANKVLRKYKTQERLDILSSLSFFEILLNRLQNNGRGNMSEEPQKVGKLLAKVNELQLQYSSIVRGVKHPTKLLGATLFKIAADNPVKALAKLTDSISLYQQWGVSYSNERNCHTGMLLTQIKKIMTDLDISKLERKMSEIDKAELLRGYMSFEKSKKKDVEAEIKPEERG